MLHRKSYSEHLIELTTPGASIFLITATSDQSDMTGPPFSVGEDEVIALYGAYFEINQLYSKPFEVPTHLQAKGLVQATEQAYVLPNKTTLIAKL